MDQYNILTFNNICTIASKLKVNMVRHQPTRRMLLAFLPLVLPWVGRFSRFTWWWRSQCSTTTCASRLSGIDGWLSCLCKRFGKPALHSSRWRRTGNFLRGRLVPARRHGTGLQRQANGGKRNFLFFW